MGLVCLATDQNKTNKYETNNKTMKQHIGCKQKVNCGIFAWKQTNTQQNNDTQSKTMKQNIEKQKNKKNKKNKKVNVGIFLAIKQHNTKHTKHETKNNHETIHRKTKNKCVGAFFAMKQNNTKQTKMKANTKLKQNIGITTRKKQLFVLMQHTKKQNKPNKT